MINSALLVLLYRLSHFN